MEVKAKLYNDITTVRLKVQHLMQAASEVSKNMPPSTDANYVQEINCEYQGKKVLQIQLGPYISDNPFFEFSFKGGTKGETLKLRWNDNLGVVKKYEAFID